MVVKVEDLLKSPLYVYDLPENLLFSFTQQEPQQQSTTEGEATQKSIELAQDSQQQPSSKGCTQCGAVFGTFQEQRQHVRSDWHRYNLKRKLAGAKIVTDNEFEKLVDDLDESLSGSGSENSDSEHDARDGKSDVLSSLLRKQAHLHEENADGEDFSITRKKRGSGKPPLVWFRSTLVPDNTSLGIYSALFTEEDRRVPSLAEALQKKQLHPPPQNGVRDESNGVPLPSTMTTPSIFMCMVGGGHFAGMIVSLAPKISKHTSTAGGQRQASVIAHKTFHRYTTRRKQGGGQSANDAAKGAAHSAGSSLRRYNEVALEQEIRALLTEWKAQIDACQLIFVRATGTTNRRILFGPYEGQVLRHNDPRNRTFPFSTRRATQSELMRAFVELTRVKISQVDEAALAAEEAARAATTASIPSTLQKPTQPEPTKPSKEDQEAQLHTGQIQALIRRSKAAALLTYLTNNKLSPDFLFQPPDSHAHHHSSTPLHLAASINSAPVVTSLLTKAFANPAILNGESKPPFDLAGDRITRDAFRVARSELGEERWPWSQSHVPNAMTKAEAEQRDRDEKAEDDRVERGRRKAEEERLRKETPATSAAADGRRRVGGRALGAVEKTAQERREEEARGMSDEMRVRLERERRARAAEARLGKLAGGGGGGR